MKNELKHPFPPLFDQKSKILILGSFPSIKSRENNFFYGHPQNRFWKVIAAVLGEPLPVSIAAKREMLLSHKIALWDSIASCEINGSSDASIRNVIPNDISVILENADISAIFCNGKKSFELYRKYIESASGRCAVCLPSTSPANAAWSLEKLIAEYSSAMRQYIN